MKFYVLIQVWDIKWEDKTEVLKSSLSGLNSGENISELVNVIYASPESLILLPWFFSQSLFYISECQLMIKISVNRYAVFG